jgi:hypothetical protein
LVGDPVRSIYCPPPLLFFRFNRYLKANQIIFKKKKKKKKTWGGSRHHTLSVSLLLDATLVASVAVSHGGVGHGARRADLSSG